MCMYVCRCTVIRMKCNTTNTAEYIIINGMAIYKCVFSILSSALCYITFIYTVDMFRALPLLTSTTVLIHQSLITSTKYIHHVFPSTTKPILLLHPSSFHGTPPCFLLVVIGDCSNTMPPCVWRTFLYLAVFWLLVTWPCHWMMLI